MHLHTCSLIEVIGIINAPSGEVFEQMSKEGFVLFILFLGVLAIGAPRSKESRNISYFFLHTGYILGKFS